MVTFARVRTRTRTEQLSSCAGVLVAASRPPPPPDDDDGDDCAHAQIEAKFCCNSDGRVGLQRRAACRSDQLFVCLFAWERLVAYWLRSASRLQPPAPTTNWRATKNYDHRRSTCSRSYTQLYVCGRAECTVVFFLCVLLVSLHWGYA